MDELQLSRQPRYDQRFLEDHAGSIIRDTTTALVELVANSWDAYATQVEIGWPSKSQAFTIQDNGIGMTEEELLSRWYTLSYNRVAQQGDYIDPPEGQADARPRPVFGRNGKGRYAAFRFSSPFHVTVAKNGKVCKFEVQQIASGTAPFEIKKLEEKDADWTGCIITALEKNAVELDAERAREILSTRFLTDPKFSVFVDGIEVSFDDIPATAKQSEIISLDDGSSVEMLIIDSQKTDRTTKQHGIAWWVNRRLVGQCGWKSLDDQSILDGRREEAKRYTFIMKADHLADQVLADWSNFKPDSTVWLETKNKCEEAIVRKLYELTAAKRREIKRDWVKHLSAKTKELPKASKEHLSNALDTLLEKCPSLGEKHVHQVMDVLANMELARSQYELLDKLHSMTSQDIDDLDDLLGKWTLQAAKEVLDEIERRLRVLQELSIKTDNKETDEVHELQPLFEQCLWIFGPQFESIEFTSNKGMTTVMRELFGDEQQGSRLRPDFVVCPDSSVGFYSRPHYDSEGDARGTEVLVIVELKRPGVSLGSSEKEQVWKYVKELEKRGHISRNTRVFGHVLGDRFAAGEDGERTEWGGKVTIKPWLYTNFILQGEKRMFQLRDRISETPFLKGYLESDPLSFEDEQVEMALEET